MKLLFIHNVGVWGGSVKSMHETLSSLQSVDGFELSLIMPKGEANRRFAELAEVYPFRMIPKIDHTWYSHYRGLRWILLIRELVKAVYFTYKIFRLRRKVPHFDIIHFNEIVCFSACIWVVTRMYPRARIFTHVRSLQKRDTDFVGRMITTQLEQYPERIICIDRCVAQTLNPRLSGKIQIVHNISGSVSRSHSYSVAGSSTSDLHILFLGGLGVEKGIYSVLEAAKYIRDHKLRVHVTIAGVRDVRGSYSGRLVGSLLNFAGFRKQLSKQGLLEYIDRENLSSVTTVLSFSSDISSLYQSADLLLFPSRLDAPGRPSIEAMAFGVPSIVFTNMPENGIVIDGFNGYNVADCNTSQMCDYIRQLSERPGLLAALKQNCLKYYSETFDINIHRSKLAKLYLPAENISKKENYQYV